MVSGGFRHLGRGVQPLARKIRLKNSHPLPVMSNSFNDMRTSDLSLKFEVTYLALETKNDDQKQVQNCCTIDVSCFY